MADLELQCDVVGATWVKMQKCWRLMIDVKENQFALYPRIPSLIDMPFTVTFSPAHAGTGRRDGKPQDVITEGQRKKLWIIFSHQAIIDFYGVKTKEEAEVKYKERMKVEHLADISKEMASASIDAMVKEIQKKDPEFK